MKAECEQILKDLTGKKHIFFVDRGNTAIKLALKYIKQKGFNCIAIQDQGGWMTYRQFAKKLNLEIHTIKTDCGFIHNLNSEIPAIINSMSAYSFLIDMKSMKCPLLINDISGSIGTGEAKIGDLIIGSFGRWKPINVEYGGFIATNEDFESFYNDNYSREIDDFYGKLYNKLKNLDKRLQGFKEKRKSIINDLKEHNIVHRDKEGINVIIMYNNDDEKQKLINYCEKNDIEHTLCPRDIRINCNAVSIEVKRS